MKIIKFDIRNFKGINHTTVHVADDAPGNVVTLIGLNESGKTTILEALSHFVTEDKDTATLVGTVQQKSSLQDLIPKDQKAAFSGRISVSATIDLDDDDVNAVVQMFIASGLVMDTGAFKRRIVVEKSYLFEDSRSIDTNTYWTISFNLKSKQAKKFVAHSGSADHKSKKEIWMKGIGLLRDRIPRIVYFPTFLFDFPDRIYLSEDSKELNTYYKQVIQDVLDSQGDSLSVDRHIVERIAGLKTEHAAVATFMAFFFGRDEKKQVEAVLQRAANEMSKVIFGSWNQILGKSVSGKRVQIDWFLDAERNNAPYLEVYIVDGQSKYSLSERSLGFRWFFSFLLFTQFRQNRKSNSGTIFLFDEPAANLHSKAQMKLLESFSRIASSTTYIIYSTHSHYMVNPLWLEKAYIVENKATDYDNDDEIDAFSVAKTDVKAVKYRNFVGSHPTKTTYFQPVLDALDMPLSPMVAASEALIVEGKFDYHPLVFMRRRLANNDRPSIFPGNGASHLEALISLFRGWGVKVRVLLDDDAAGRRAKKQYLADLLLGSGEIATIGDIDPSLSGKTFEALYKDDVRDAVSAMFSTQKPLKRQYALLFQELIAQGSTQNFPQTESSFKSISDWIDEQFDN